MKCAICGVHVIKPVTIKASAGVNGNRPNGIVSEWKFLSLQSFYLLFGLPPNAFPKNKFMEDLCHECLQEVSDAHYVLWQLHNLERKVQQLQNCMFEKLWMNYEVISALESEDVKEATEEMEYSCHVKTLFQEIQSQRESWPKENFSSKWREAQDLLPSGSDDKPLRSRVTKLEDSVPTDPLDVGTTDFLEEDDELNDPCWNAEEDTEYQPDEDLADPEEQKCSDPDEDEEWTGVINKRTNSSKRISGKIKTRKKRGNKGVERPTPAKKGDKGMKKVKEFPCTVDPKNCKRQYSDKYTLHVHIRTAHPDKLLTCGIDDCKFKVAFEERLEAHRNSVHFSKEKVICEICGASVLPQLMKRHYNTNHLGFDTFSCPRCSMTFSQQGELKSHEELHNDFLNSFPFTCVISPCGEVFGSSLELKSHVMDEHVTKGWLKCDICGVAKRNEFLLRSHKRVAHQTKTFICDECPMTFNNVTSFRTHKDRVHLGKTYACRTCGKEYDSASKRGRHERNHLLVKPFKCSVCPKSFHSGQILKRHEVIHSGVKNYCCELCGKRFKQVGNLKQHLNTDAHKGQKTTKTPYQMFDPEKPLTLSIEKHDDDDDH